MQLGRLYQDTVDQLDRAGIEHAEIDAVQLFEFCLGVTREKLFLYPEMQVDEEQARRLDELLQRRLKREPLQYIVGTREFWSREFIVSPAVLIPRPETEFLLEHVLAVVRRGGFRNGPILDMCTGSGVIALVLAIELGAKNILAVDRSFAALQIAARNRARHADVDTVSLLCSDLFNGLQTDARFELIVANPPYVSGADLASLQPEVREWEPHTALLGGRMGLDIIEKLAFQGHTHLEEGGWIFIEIGADQENAVYSLFIEQAGKVYEDVAVVPDWSGRPRVLQARKKDRG